MSAFGSPWGDVDKTRPGTPYVVDSDGWGWLLLLIVFALPLLLLASLVSEVGGLIFRYPWLFGGAYLALSVWVSFLKYKGSPKRHRIPGTLASLLTMLSFGIVEALYALPYMALNSLLSGLIEWFFVTVFMLGITVFLMTVIKNGFLHLFLAVLISSFTTLVVLGVLNGADTVNWDAVIKLYSGGAG